ncbi:HAD-IIIA family hydrolase [Aestuariivirga sp.]|uniref:HAD-IIIA family hydrolase n=1 Tax=Aestuariivirga sp. TaxID=2650926 RepID=UPI00391DDA60
MRDDFASVRLFIFDADGTLRWTTIPEQKYPLGRSEWQLMPGVAERLRAIPWAPGGPWLAVASNQNGVAAGELAAEMARGLIEDMLAAALGAVPPETEIAMCTCDERLDCACRKPAPGMLLGLLDRFGVRPDEALYVGDLPIDAEAARRARVPFIFARDFFASS